MPVQRELLVLVGQGAAAQPHLHDVVVEIGHLGPSLAHLRSQQLRMPAAGEDRIGVVVDHDAVFAPQQHDGHGRPQQGVGDGFQALGPRRERSEAGFRPVELPISAASSPPAVGNDPPDPADTPSSGTFSPSECPNTNRHKCRKETFVPLGVPSRGSGGGRFGSCLCRVACPRAVLLAGGSSAAIRGDPARKDEKR